MPPAAPGQKQHSWQACGESAGPAAPVCEDAGSIREDVPFHCMVCPPDIHCSEPEGQQNKSHARPHLGYNSLVVCRTSTAEEVSAQAGIKKRSRGGSADSEAEAPGAKRAHRTAAALHYLRTGEEVVDKGEQDVEAVARQLQLEALGMSDCGDCERCMEGANCKRVANREASRRGRRGATWAEEAERLVGRVFQVCALHPSLATVALCMCAVC